MSALRRRWQSIDHKLPLLASGLVLLTATVLGATAYVLVERALLEAAGRRLFSTATFVAQLVQRPSSRVTDSTMLAANRTLRAFVRGKVGADVAMLALSPGTAPRDTLKFYGGLLDTSGRTLLAYRRPPARESKWVVGAIRRGEIGGDTTSMGPLENLGNVPAVTQMRALRETEAASSAVIGYIVDSRSITGQGARQFRGIIGDGVELLLGQPGAGIWTDLERIAAAPPVISSRDSIIVFDGGVGAFVRVSGVNWMVWLSQPTGTLIAPARRLLWSLIPIGLAIALVGAALMWVVTRRITHPIVQLTAAAENVAADNGASGLQPTVLIAADADEVARLRYAFERMAHRVSERQTLELQLRHAQKMEAVGRLAGGIAHDFNNLLTAIRSYSDLMLEDMPMWDAKRSDVLEIRSAAQRAATLTAQLLAFSRKQMLQPRVLDTAAVLSEVQGMLHRLLIEDIHLKVTVPPGLWPVKADRGQLEQVIVNLAVNARDAMPHGGALIIAAANEMVSEPIETKHDVVPAGEYVAIRVTDSGVGMDAATQAQIFEPFFTTKPVGQGTGLGLATVHGIVLQSGGHITVESTPQRGTTFTVYLPRALEDPAADTATIGVPSRGKNETILLVEDEPAVRVLARRVLTRAGFRILESTSPTDALRLAEMHAGKIDLVLSDVVMPEMSGPVLVAKLAEICPTARVLFISGYTDDEVIGRGLSNPGMMLLQKPFSAQELVERVRLALEQVMQEEPAAEQVSSGQP